MEAKKQKRKQSEKLQNDDKLLEMISNVTDEVSSWPKWLKNNAETLFTDSYNSNELLIHKNETQTHFACRLGNFFASKGQRLK